MNSIHLIALLIYFAVGTLIAYVSRRMGVKSASDYYVAGGRMGALLAAGTYAATTYSAFMMVGLVGLTYQTGVGALGFELVYLVSTVTILSTLGFKIWKLARTRKWISPSQMIGDLYGSKTLAVTVAFLYLFAMIPYTVAQIQGLGVIFQVSGLEYVHGVMLGAAIILLWIVLAGIWSVASTDLYQGILMLAGGLVFLSWTASTLSQAADISEVFETLGDQGFLGLTSFWSMQVFLAYTIPWVFFAVTNPQVVSRFYVHRDVNAYKKSVALFSAYGFIYTFIAISIGLFARMLAIGGLIPEDLPRDSVTPSLLKLMTPASSAIVSVSIMAAAISTANSIVLSVSSSVFKDILNREEKSLRAAFIINLLLTLTASGLAILRLGYIVDLSVLTSVLLLPLAPITLLGIWRQGKLFTASRIAAVAAIVTGAGIGVYGFIAYGAAKTFTMSYLHLPISAWVLLSSTIILVLGSMVDELRRKSEK
ncbi:sodium:solute symporter family protein [Thermosphaera chiliense]|uniref:Sodium:solute symporter family protein n=1 Tax=Thermosphaera chiliense TaxID=3402707 RepID=A0A7M1UPQ6_9CREN|nr:sodium:solute symporter family protein [Thermosphaera aggregans]QOR94220.1 sodium:solute symporter family protein [Thermosphaera aggregans]